MKFHRYPLLPVLVCIIGGIVTARFISLGWIFLLSGLLITAGMIIYNKIYPAILLCSYLLGVGTGIIHLDNKPDIELLNNSDYFVGTVQKTGVNRNGQRLIVKIDSIGIEEKTFAVPHFNVILNLFQFETGLTSFDRIRFHAKLKPVNYDSDESAKKYSNYYFNNNIHGVSFLSMSRIHYIGREKSVDAYIKEIRDRAIHQLQESNLNPDCCNFLEAVLLGETENFTKSQRDIFSNAGIAHVLALSGTHVMIIASFVFFLLLPLRKFGWRNIVFAVVIIIMWLYAILTGLSPSVTRAVIMLSVLYVARMCSRQGNSINSLCFAGILIIVFSPRSLFTASFQLSFCAVASILLFAKTFNLLNGREYRNNLYRSLNFISSGIGVSIAALIGTGLLSIYYFNKFPVYSVLANIPALILLPVLIGSGLLIILGGFIGLQIGFIEHIADWCHNLLYRSCIFFDSLPYSTINDIETEGIIFVPYVASLFLFALYLQKKDKFYAISSMSAILMCLPFIG